ncbi:MAG: SUMF1/EgtB/PvdO family nonheme iron enzyme [Caldilineaceae bacterium]|nr:SUMF1/EgtB/PvdO family nonheme iron enzyme [Caldilineaceae bacterium]
MMVQIQRRVVMIAGMIAVLAVAACQPVSWRGREHELIRQALQINQTDGAVYVYVPGGEAVFGYAGSISGEVMLPVASFWIMRTEVTNALYARCVAAGSCTPPANDRWQDLPFARHPVVNVSWAQAARYADWAGGRLPTEIEWEKACRGVDGRAYPWGDREPDPALANYNGAVGDTTPTGRYPAGASPYGALDMAGNVWEWTSSPYAANPYTPETMALAARGHEPRTLRGGSYLNPAGYGIPCTSRGWDVPALRISWVGFRVVLDERD